HTGMQASIANQGGPNNWLQLFAGRTQIAHSSRLACVGNNTGLVAEPDWLTGNCPQMKSVRKPFFSCRERSMHWMRQNSEQRNRVSCGAANRVHDTTRKNVSGTFD